MRDRLIDPADERCLMWWSVTASVALAMSAILYRVIVVLA
jgi:hypothetical protein